MPGALYITDRILGRMNYRQKSSPFVPCPNITDRDGVPNL